MQLSLLQNFSDLRMEALWGKTGVYMMAIVLAFVLELMAQMQNERIARMTPAQLYHVGVLRAKYHNAAVITMLSAIAIGVILH
jgi:hypothetical protein